MFNIRSNARTLIAGTILCLVCLSNLASAVDYGPSSNQVFYLEYSLTVTDCSINYSAFLGDLSGATQQLNQQLNLQSNGISVQNIQLGQQSNSAYGPSKKRPSNDVLVFICQVNYPSACRTSKCQQNVLKNIQQQASNNPSINLQLRSTIVAAQTIQLCLEFLSFSLNVPDGFTQTGRITNVCCNQQPQTNIPLVQQCIGQDLSRQPIIIDTDVDVDDLWAILYLVNVPTVNILAITTVGDGFSTAFYSTSNVLSFLGVIGCTDGIAVATGISKSSSDTGYVVSPPSYLVEVDTYITSPTCLNQSTNIFLQPSPFEAVELMIYALKYSQRPVDILALGPFTNIAAAITRDRSIVSKIGTVYASGGQFVSLSANPTLTPNPNLGMYPYIQKTSGTSSNVFIDVLAVQRVDQSGIKNFVVIPSLVQRQVNANITQLNQKIQQLNINLTPFIYGFISSFAKCTNQPELFVNWWDNSAAQLMVQIQNNVTNGFCTTLQNEQSLYLLSADADQLYGEGLTDITNTRPNTNGVRNDTVCTQANSDIFLTEFLTKIASNKFYSCEKTFSNRFDIKLQSCLSQYGYN